MCRCDIENVVWPCGARPLRTVRGYQCIGIFDSFRFCKIIKQTRQLWCVNSHLFKSRATIRSRVLDEPAGRPATFLFQAPTPGAAIVSNPSLRLGNPFYLVQRYHTIALVPGLYYVIVASSNMLWHRNCSVALTAKQEFDLILMLVIYLCKLTCSR